MELTTKRETALFMKNNTLSANTALCAGRSFIVLLTGCGSFTLWLSVLQLCCTTIFS